MEKSCLLKMMQNIEHRQRMSYMHDQNFRTLRH